jgi:signal transduction histidine kinase
MRSLNRAWQPETQAMNLLQRERDLLEQRVVERTHDLAEARDQALEASQFKTQLLAKVSHELRTPLGVILGYTELLREDTFGQLSQRQKEVADEVIDSTYQLTSLVNELLDEAQFEASAIQLKLVAFDPKILLQQIEIKMAILAQRKKLTLTTTLDLNLPNMLYGDKERLQQSW